MILFGSILGLSTCAIPPSSITNELGEFVNNELGSDISQLLKKKNIRAQNYVHEMPLLAKYAGSNM